MKRVKYYSDEFKKAVVKEIILGELSQLGAMRKYGIGGSTTVSRWIAKFKDMVPKEEQSEGSVAKSKEELEEEIQRLKRQLEYEKLKSEAFDKMIKLAEEEFKIPIRKKRGAKRSKK